MLPSGLERERTKMLLNIFPANVAVKSYINLGKDGFCTNMELRCLQWDSTVARVCLHNSMTTSWHLLPATFALLRFVARLES